MRLMSVTLDVSKLSGWLNAVAYCRVGRKACDAGRGAAAGGYREAGGRGGASSAQGGARLKGLGHRARAERTWNMPVMSVTPEVTQLEMPALKFCKL